MNDSPLVFFSVDDARALVAERNRLLREYEDVNRKVQALSVLVPENMRERIFGSALSPTPTPANGDPPAKANAPFALRDALVRLLDDALEVMEHEEIEEQIWLNPDFSDREKNSAIEIAKHLERAARNGQIGKRGSKYYSRKISPKIDAYPVIDGPTIIGVAEKTLREAEKGLEAGEVVRRMMQNSQLSDSPKLRPNAVYAALSRLVDRRIASRDSSGVYSIATK